MMKINKLLLLGVVFAMLIGCSGQQTKDDDDATNANDQDQQNGVETGGLDQGSSFYGHELDNPESLLSKRVIYFDFDQATVKAEYQAIIRAHSSYVASHPSARVTLEGHADERGTREYNLGLGEKRGKAIANLMQALGAQGNQLEIVSYGEERPVALCSDESCWSQNRRVEIIYTAR